MAAEPTAPDRPSGTGLGAAPRRSAPPPALAGFVVILALMFSLAYAAGSLAGPVAPGMHPVPSGGVLTGNRGGGGHIH